MIAPAPTTVRAAIEAEINASPDKLACRVVSLGHDKAAEVWTLEVDLLTQGVGLDESLQGVSVWWPPEGSGRAGVAEVLAVIPEDNTLHLWRYSRSPPEPDGSVFLFPRQFLTSLLNVWTQRGETCVASLQRLLNPGEPSESTTVDIPSAFSGLRAGQKEAFSRALPLDMAWLWGPPGTGKTYTLGRMIATWLLQQNDKPSLLLGPTNVAVDQALLEVDKALEELARSGPTGVRRQARKLRKRCKRIGTRFDPGRYEGRDHLIPKADPELLNELKQHELTKPETANRGELAAWQEKYEALRERLRNYLEQLLPKCSLVAMTCVRALDGYDLLRGALPAQPFSKVFFDEASQIGLGTAAALLDLGEGSLFSGDPFQLAPIVKSSHSGAQQWLARSPFVGRTPSRTVVLNEQGRMARPVCKVISEVFYEGRLKVAEELASDPRWRARRNLCRSEGLKGRLIVQYVEDNATWWPAVRSHVRDSSADWIVDAVRELVHAGQKQGDILILTPFRGQRYKLQRRLKEAGLPEVEVSTVHRAQGGERHTVIFDPTKEAAKFLKRPDTWRLVNVALSRAMARIILVTSKAGEEGNELIRLMAFAMRGETLTPFNEAVGRHRELLPTGYFTRVPREVTPPALEHPIVGNVSSMDEKSICVHDALSHQNVNISTQKVLRWPPAGAGTDSDPR